MVHFYETHLFLQWISGCLIQGVVSSWLHFWILRNYLRQKAWLWIFIKFWLRLKEILIACLLSLLKAVCACLIHCYSQKFRSLGRIHLRQMNHIELVEIMRSLIRRHDFKFIDWRWIKFDFIFFPDSFFPDIIEFLEVFVCQYLIES